MLLGCERLYLLKKMMQHTYPCVVFLFFKYLLVHGGGSESPFPANKQFSMNINMPDVKPDVPDAYLCTAKKLDPHESYIVQYEPDANSQTAHHMLLFGCKNLHNQRHLYPGYWNCAQGDLCNKISIMYGWAKNAPTMRLPPDVGFLVGGNSSIQYVVLQIHYANPLKAGATDNSGLKLHITSERQKYVTGIHLLLSNMARIPPHKPKFHVDVNCKYDGTYPIHVFAYRVHTHRLGVVVSGYQYNTINDSWSFLAKGNPQWPQAFYPMHNMHTITNNDILAARCTYNSSDMDEPVMIGSQSSDEMCNLYLMYYTEYRNSLRDQFSPCIGVSYTRLIEDLPLGNDVPLPRDQAMEQQAFGDAHHPDHPITYNGFENSRFHTTPHLEGTGVVALVQTKNEDSPEIKMNSEYKFKSVHGWPANNLKFGQIAAVTVNHKGNVVIFHRGSHVWNERTFDYSNKYLLSSEGPITEPTVVVLDSITGLVLEQWGSHLFYMPHGLFIDTDGTYWVTDVALHQVLKFSPTNLKHPSITLGEAFINGDDPSHFCKPASVAVSKNGEIYIADGYCNSRIVKFSPDGKFLSQWGKQDDPLQRNPPVGTFRVPHKVTLLEDHELACVADRENARIQCFTMGTGRYRFKIQREEFGDSLYSIAYAQEKGLLLAVCGESFQHGHLVNAFVFNITDQKLLNTFAPPSGTFTRPHDIAVLPNGEEAYVCEIGPNIVWKFMRVYHKSTKKVLETPQNAALLPIKNNMQISVVQEDHHPHNKSTVATEEELTNFETSMIIMSLLAIPVLCMVLVTVIIRLKKRGKLQHCYFGHFKGWLGGYRTPYSQDKFNLGNLLNPHKGFDRVSVEESDADMEEGSESDNEEFITTAKKT